MTKYFCSFRSLASITIDYGPFGFVDDYDAYYTPNHSDDGGRYDFANQPDVAEWNLKMLAMSLMPIIPSESNSFDFSLTSFLLGEIHKVVPMIKPY